MMTTVEQSPDEEEEQEEEETVFEMAPLADDKEEDAASEKDFIEMPKDFEVKVPLEFSWPLTDNHDHPTPPPPPPTIASGFAATAAAAAAMVAPTSLEDAKPLQIRLETSADAEKDVRKKNPQSNPSPTLSKPTD